ncbi:MAG: hypothetical protein GX664_04170 [Bacteroidales bacterium]|nr:hypothetical protein [Bacteroidales bacterium]
MANQKPKPPKGFDISLADAILEFHLGVDEIQFLGELTAKRQIAHAVVGHNVYYRRSTIEGLFNGKQADNK